VLNYDADLYNISCQKCIINSVEGTVSFNNGRKTIYKEVALVVSSLRNKRTVKIHTTCLDPIGPGEKFGPLTVVNATSLNGGKVCSIRTPGISSGKKVTALYPLEDQKKSFEISIFVICMVLAGGLLLISYKFFYRGFGKNKSMQLHRELEVDMLGADVVMSI